MLSESGDERGVKHLSRRNVDEARGEALRKRDSLPREAVSKWRAARRNRVSKGKRLAVLISGEDLWVGIIIFLIDYS